MYALGVPTTRALCLVASPEPVRRERWEAAAVVTRVAPSFIRFGHFEQIFVSTETNQEHTYTFRELHAEVQRMAAILQSLGVVKGDRSGWSHPRRARFWRLWTRRSRSQLRTNVCWRWPNRF